jgi:hypothetical protein
MMAASSRSMYQLPLASGRRMAPREGPVNVTFQHTRASGLMARRGLVRADNAAISHTRPLRPEHPDERGAESSWKVT